MKNTSNIFPSKKWNRSLLATALVFAVDGTVHAQTGSSAEAGRSASRQASKTPAKSGSAAQRKSQGSSGWDQYTYGQDTARDYTLAGACPSGETSYIYGKDAASDYSRSRGMGMGTAGGRGSVGSGSSSSQSNYD